MVRLKNAARVRYGLGQPPPERQDGILMIRATDISAGRIIDENMLSIDPDFLPLDRDPYLKEDEIIVVRSGAYTGDSAIVPRKYAGAVAGYDMVVTVKHAAPRFIAHCLLSDSVLQGQLLLLTLRAAQPHLNAKELGGIQLALPPLPEQERIAAYLDASCAAIDAAVDIKRRQINTLEGLRRAALHATFTSDGWPTKRIKDVAKRIGSGVTPTGGASGYLDEGIPLLRSQNVHFDGLHLDDVAFISEETHADMAGSQIKPHDVLVNITGASIGRCTYVPDDFGEGNVNQHVCTIRGNEKVDHKFLAAFLSSPMGQGQILSSFTGASRQGLSHKELALIRVPLPPADVQRETVTIIERNESQRSKLRTIINLQIETLTAYRKSLIHECVTGQRQISETDVRRVSQDSGLDQDLLAEAGV